MKNYLLKFYVPLIMAFISSTAVSYCSYMLDDDRLEFPFYGLIFGVVTSVYIYLLVKLQDKNKIKAARATLIWIFASGISWFAAYQLGFAAESARERADAFGDLFQVYFFWSLVGGFVGALIVNFALFMITKKLVFKDMLKFSALASLAAVLATVLAVPIGDTIFTVHLFWQVTVLYLVHRHLVSIIL